MALCLVPSRTLCVTLLTVALMGVHHGLHDHVFGVQRPPLVTPIAIIDHAVFTEPFYPFADLPFGNTDSQPKRELAEPTPADLVRLVFVWRSLWVIVILVAARSTPIAVTPDSLLILPPFIKLDAEPLGLSVRLG